MSNPELPQITCAQCDKLVDEIEVHTDFAQAVTIFMVKCHGAKDQCEIPYFDICDNGPEPYMTGVAFQNKDLSPPELRLGNGRE